MSFNKFGTFFSEDSTRKFGPSYNTNIISNKIGPLLESVETLKKSHDSLEKLLTEISTLISTEILVHTTQIPYIEESVGKLKSFAERLEIDIQFIRPLIEEEIAATRNSLRLSREDLINKIRQIEKRIDFIMIKIDGSETEV